MRSPGIGAKPLQVGERRAFSAEALQIAYANRIVISSISCTAQRGDFILLLGPSGIGKSTFGKALAKSLPAEAQVAGELQVGESPVAYLWQEPSASLHPLRPILQQVEDVVVARRRRGRQGPAGFSPKQEAEKLLSAFGLLEHGHQLRHTLSSGQQQRAALARALAMEPALLIADEPTAALDEATEREVVNHLADWQRQRAEGEPLTVLWITHRQAAAAGLANRVWRLWPEAGKSGGSLVGRLYEEPIQGSEDGQKAAAGQPKEVESRNGQVARQETGQKAGQKTEQEAKQETLLEAKRVAKRYGNRGVQEASLTLHAGENVLVQGRSGSGKSTLAKVLAGLLPPESGELQTGRHVQLVWPDPATAFHPGWSVEEAMTEPLRIQGGFSREERLRLSEQWLGAVQLSREVLPKPVEALSGGQRRLVLLARALLAATLQARPPCLLLDEPTNGLDLALQLRLLQSLAVVQQQHQAAYLWMTNDPGLAAWLQGMPPAPTLPPAPLVVNRCYHLAEGRLHADVG